MAGRSTAVVCGLGAAWAIVLVILTPGAAASGFTFGSLAVPAQRSSLPYEDVFGPVYNAPSEDMAYTLIQKMCGWSTGCRYMNFSGWPGMAPYVSVASSPKVAHMAWADSQVNANNRALKVCGTSDCEVVFQGQINSSPWASDATFQALAITHDDLDSTNGNVAVSAPGTQQPGDGLADPAETFDDAIEGCRRQTGQDCYVVHYVTQDSHRESYDCTTVASCRDASGLWHREADYGPNKDDSEATTLRNCRASFGGTCTSDNACTVSATTCA